MEINISKDNHKSIKHHSSKVCSIKTEDQINKDCSLNDINSKERHISTVQNINNKQKLFDFISDKKKLSLNTFFDHKGTKEFLMGKNEAMRKIELDEIELNEDNKKFSNIKKRSISKKKLSKQKSVGFTLKRSSKKSLKIESTQKIKLKKKHKSLSTKHFTHHEDAKNSTFKEKFVHFNIKERSANDDRISKSHGHEHEHENEHNEHTHKKKKSSLIKKKIKKNNEKINIDKSINSINTVNSKLFNNEKEYNNFKRLLTKDDVPILEDILYELDVNKK